MEARQNPYRSRRVLVTGADGFIGSHVAEALVAAGARVTALSLYNSFGQNGWLDELPGDVHEEIEIKSGDVRDANFVDGLVAGHDFVLHLAALIAIPYSYVAPQSYVDTNITGTLNVLEACRRHGVRRLVHTSTSEVYGTATFTPITEAHPLRGQSPYAASKIGADMMVESYAKSFDVPAIILRPFNTYGPRQSERAVIPTVIRQALDPDCDAIHLGDLTPKRDFNFVADTAAAFLTAGAAEGLDYGTAYNAGSGTAVSVGEMVELVRRITGTNKPVEADAARLRPAGSEVYELIAAAERFTTATGWQPVTPLAAGLEQTVDWWRGRVAQGRVRRGIDHLL